MLDIKNLHKISKIAHSTSGGPHHQFFRVFINTQGRQKSARRRVRQKKLVNFDKMSNFFRQSFFRNFFVYTFFSEFFWKVKLIIFGKNNVFRPFQVFHEKFTIFFRKKSWFFSIFFRKKNLQKNTKKRDFAKSASVDFRGDCKKCKKKYEKKVDFYFFKPLAKMIIYQKTQFFSSETEKV